MNDQLDISRAESEGMPPNREVQPPSLLPCPFCGSQPSLFNDVEEGVPPYLACVNEACKASVCVGPLCGILNDAGCRDIDGLIAAWNHRA
jgi:hypothetical protein